MLSRRVKNRHTEVTLPSLRIPICKPLLPTAETILPYLRRIDETRIYTNFGPLSSEFETRFAARSGIEDAVLVATANGTQAIQAALMASCGSISPDRRTCMLPAFTFAASVSAVENAGLTPYFVDVDADTGMIDLDRLRNDPLLDQVAAVLLVGAFGRIPDLAKCASFEADTGIAVIVDAAGGSDAVLSGSIASLHGIKLVFSFHATKAFGIGEGGGVLMDDTDRAMSLRRVLNFGFDADRIALSKGFNGKMSEFAAAIGLALLDQWADFSARYISVRESYFKAFTRAEDEGLFWMEKRWLTTYPHILVQSPDQRVPLVEAFKAAGVDTRRWWGEGAHRHPAHADIPRNPLPNTDMWTSRLIGLPYSIDLHPDAVDHIASVANPILFGDADIS